jgi:hypothetical protein
MATTKDGEKPEKNKRTGKSGSIGIGYTTKLRKATKDERIAVRGTGARKSARKGELTAIYTEDKGGRPATSRNSGTSVTPMTEATRSVGKNTTQSPYGAVPNKYKRESVTADANRSFYGDTKLGRRLVKKAVRKGSPGISGVFKEKEVKKRFQNKTK